MKNNTFKKSSIYFDVKPVENSENAITSGAVFNAIASNSRKIFDLIYPIGFQVLCGSQTDAQSTLEQLQANIATYELDANFEIFSIGVGSENLYGIKRVQAED